MNQFVVLVVFGLILSPCLAQVHGNDEHSSSEEADPADVEEEGCPRITHLKDIDLRHFYGQWHLPYVSNHWIRYMAKRMHGKFMKKSRMGQTCVKMDLKPMAEEQMAQNDNATVWIHSKCPRTGAELNLACTPSTSNNAKWYCQSKDSEDHEGDSWVYVVDSDNKTWALVVRCFPNNGMNWAIFSKVKELDPKLVKSLLKEVEEMGFQLWNIVQVPYEKCVSKI